MATTIPLEGAARTEFGKGAARRMRAANLIPATVYAGGEEPVFVQLPMKETTLSLRHTNALFTIKFGDETKMAVVKDVQRNPVKRIVELVDFYEVKAGEKIDVEVPVFVEGTPKGAAVAFVDIQELKVRADVANLPEKIVVNVGRSEARENAKVLDAVVSDLTTITGQKAVITHAKKSVANFKLRAGMPIGAKVTLRGNKMWEFLDRLFNVALPRVRDFRGISADSFDGRGNYALGIKEQLIFPEIEYDKIDKIRGMDIVICTTAQTDEEARELLTLVGAPFER